MIITANRELLFKQAKLAMQQAYVPYSKYSVGAAIFSDDGEIFTGCNVENAAYGLTLCAEAVAIGNMVNAGRRRINEVLVVAASAVMCSPCGACRQRIREFADADTVVHLCDQDAIRQSITLNELLPHAFGPNNITTDAG